MTTRPLSRRLTALVLLVALGIAVAACGSSDDGKDDTSSGSGSEKAVKLSLGYFPNVTHATAIVGDKQGIFTKALGSDVDFSTKTFNAGPDAVTALTSGAIDATYIGPNPAINAFQKSNGEAVRIISGATSGGAFLVVNENVKSAADLKGEKVASPQLGNTQDVALRAWLKSEGLKTDQNGGGDVAVVAQENSATLAAFKAGDIAGAWVPEPWATRLIQEGGGKVLVDERDLWPNGKYVTTHLIVRTDYLDEHPDVIKKLLEGQVEATDWVNENSAEAQKVVGDAIAEITQKPLPEGVLSTAWKNLTFTVDPVASSLQKSAEDAKSVGLLESTDIDGIYSLDLLNEVLKADGQDEVKGL